jgi:DNA modification methylase
MGSGTTGVAAVQKGVQFIGIEKNEAYFEVAIKRIAEAMNAPKLFTETVEPAKQTALFEPTP